MKTRKLRLVSALLAVAMMLALLPTAAFAAAEVAHGTCGAEGNNLTWTLDDSGTLTISGSGEMADYASADKQPWANQKSSIKKLLLERA